MSQVITITGVTVASGSAQALDISGLYLSPIKSILKAEQIINPHTHVFTGTSATPAGTVAAPVFTGAALAAHGHVLHLNNADVADGATTRINAGGNLLGANTGADIAVASVADTSGVGGIVQITAGTPAGTNSAPAFTGTAATPAGTNASGKPTRAELTVVTVTPTATNKIQRTGNAALSMWLTTAMTVDDLLILTIEERGSVVRP